MIEVERIPLSEAAGLINIGYYTGYIGLYNVIFIIAVGQEVIMACFLVSAAEAVIVTVAQKHCEHKEMEKTDNADQCQAVAEAAQSEGRMSWSRKLKILSNLLWGGAFLLLFEHIWHGEIVPWFPFFTAAQKGEVGQMLKEMATTGVLMAVLVTVVWACALFVISRAEKKAVPEPEEL